MEPDTSTGRSLLHRRFDADGAPIKQFRSLWLGRSRLPLQILALTALLATGLWLRTLPPMGVATDIASWWPWSPARIATLYFSDGQFLFPVSRRIPSSDDLPRAVLEALLAGPRADSGLVSPIPKGVEIRAMTLVSGEAWVDLSSEFLAESEDTRAAEFSILETLTSLPDITSVAIGVEGEPVTESTERVPLVYLPSSNGLVALRALAATPKGALNRYVGSPPDPDLTLLPSDVRLLEYDYDGDDRLVSLNFSYTPSVRALALDKPERMRLLLLGLIAGLTEFPEVDAVRVEFEGHASLGLGECSDLLHSRQPRPGLLNDERLLGGNHSS